jgi:hypothetical protein
VARNRNRSSMQVGTITPTALGTDRGCAHSRRNSNRTSPTSPMEIEGSRGDLSVGFQNSAPHHFPDAQGNSSGPVVEILREAARRKNIRLTWVYSPQGPEKALTSGTVDLWPIMRDLPERRGFLYVSAPWARMTYVLIASRSLRLRGTEDVGTRSVAVANINLDSRLARQHSSKATILRVPSGSEVIPAVCAGSAEAVS